MTLAEAIELIRPAISPTGGIWADLGAGTGLFSRALAKLLGPDGTVIAVDQDASALGSLRKAARENEARIVTAVGGFTNLDVIEALESAELDGALCANSLHYLPQPGHALSQITRRLRAGGRIIVVEYEDRKPNRWVPYPISFPQLEALAEETSLGPPRIVGRRPSRFGGGIYAAVLIPRASPDPSGRGPRGSTS